MKKKYKIPIHGKVINDNPLTGGGADPLCSFPLAELPNLPTYFDKETQQQEPERFGYICVEYDLDKEEVLIELEASEEFHNWLVGMLPQLRHIQKKKGWKLDKSKMVEKLKEK